jgi:hypothetical protein
MPAARRILAVAFTIVILTVPAHAQQMRVAVYGETPALECEFVPVLGGIGYARVIVKNTVPFEKVRFRAPIPPCSGLAFGGDIVTDGTATGDSQSGIEITRSSCTSGPGDIEVLQIIYAVVGPPTGTCQWSIEPYPGDAMAEVIDCDGYTGWADGNGAGIINGDCGLIGENNFIGPYRPVPVDGAGGVAVNALLEWTGPANTLWLADHPFDVPIPGHNHFDDDVVYSTGAAGTTPPPYDPGPLAPNTTYYWRGAHFCFASCPHGGEGFSPNWDTGWTFTMEGALPAEEESWGRIKALYR